jgi:hypothetical protein
MAILRGFSWSNPFLKVGFARASVHKIAQFFAIDLPSPNQKWAKARFCK